MSGRVTAENALVEAAILAAKVLEEYRNSIVLVFRARKMVREADPRDLRSDFRELVRRSANGCDPGTCKTVMIW